MGEYRSPTFKQPFTLETLDLQDDTHVQELVRQRIICGWGEDEESINNWRNQTSKGTKKFWWITIPATDEKTSDPSSTSSRGIKAGHIALASETSPPDPDLARLDRSILTVNTFFLLPEYRALGLGRASWFAVEEKAKQIPECKQIAIDTWDGRYVTDKGPEWGGFLATLGIVMRDSLINEEWYARMGYEKFKTEPRYPLPGTDRMMVAVFLRKYLD